MIRTYDILTFEQPIGNFVMAVLPVNDILSLHRVDRREFDVDLLDTKGGPQRQLSKTRANEIAMYAETADATFPTPIILALKDGCYEIKQEAGKNIISISGNNVASVVDGQHRLLGIGRSLKKEEFHLPVVFVLDASEEQKALIFAIINGKQARVSQSLIYDLFGVTEGRNIFKTCHEIARALNSDPKSPFERKLKMLGNKIPGSKETLSQGTFVKFLLPLISNNASEDFGLARKGAPLPKRDCIFNRYFLEGRDDIITKILLNLFSAVKDCWQEEWDDEKSILAKTTGYTGIMNALPVIYKLGEEKGDLTFVFFKDLFIKVKEILASRTLKLDNDSFPAGGSGDAKLSKLIIEAVGKLRE